MKTNTMTLGIALISGIAFAQEGQRPQDHRPPPHPILVILDADRDGALSTDEIDGASDALAKLDRDNDGRITREELRPPRPDRGNGDGEKRPPGPPQGHRQPPPVIAALDTDRDGTITAGELDEAPDSLLDLDMNGDGELSPRELHPHGPPPPPPGEGPGDGEPE